MSNIEKTAQEQGQDNAQEQGQDKKKKKEKLVPLTLGLTYNKETDEYPEVFCFNFKTYAVKRGEEVMVPPAIKKMAEKRDKAKRKAYEYATSKSLSAKEAEFNQRYNLK